MSDGRRRVTGEVPRHPGPDGILNTQDDKIGSLGPVRRGLNGRTVRDPVFGLEPVVGVRRAPTTINASFMTTLFWDGRVSSGRFNDPVTGQNILFSGGELENLIAEPPLNVAEMGHPGRTWGDVVDRIATSTPLALSPQVTAELGTFIQGRSYPDLFQAAFGTPDVTAARAIMAIATYMRTLTSDQSRFDEAEAGVRTLTPSEFRGQQLFNTHGCSSCHVPPSFTDNLLHNTGVRPPSEDLGGGAVQGLNAPAGSFRTPSLRNVALRGPYFHHGGFETLEEVIDFYARGGDFAPSSPVIQQFTITPQERADMVAFLHALTDNRVANEFPPFDRPELGSNRRPTRLGRGTPGTGGEVPEIRSYSLPAAGNADFEISLDNALGGAAAYMVISPAWYPPSGLGFAGVRIYPNISHPATMIAPMGVLPGTGAGEGWTTLSLELPANTTLVGFDFYFQWLVVDQGAPGGLLSASDALRARIY